MVVRVFSRGKGGSLASLFYMLFSPVHTQNRCELSVDVCFLNSWSIVFLFIICQADFLNGIRITLNKSMLFDVFIQHMYLYIHRR